MQSASSLAFARAVSPRVVEAVELAGQPSPRIASASLAPVPAASAPASMRVAPAEAPSSSAPAASAAPSAAPGLAPAGQQAEVGFSARPAEPAATVPAAAARLVERVAELVEHLGTRAPAEQVRLSLDLAGEHRVEVKVSLRGGKVFADFRTESAEMRSALAQAWDGFVRGRDGASRRWADPVFASTAAPVSAAAPSPSAAPSPDSAARDHGFSDSDPRHAPHREHSDPRAPSPFIAPPRVARSVSSSVPVSAGSVSADLAGPSTSRHLSARA